MAPLLVACPASSAPAPTPPMERTADPPGDHVAGFDNA